MSAKALLKKKQGTRHTNIVKSIQFVGDAVKLLDLTNGAGTVSCTAIAV
tara:strand:+ start:1657 stop:1803 length:147 start_codon:yes stop_codon:yes gene_type:complete